jgi:hypothetical protein
VVEVTLEALAPYYETAVFGSAAWGRNWLRLSPGNRRRLGQVDAHDVDILWISNFTMSSLRTLVRAERVVFRFFDHLHGFRGMPRSVLDVFKRFAQEGDLVVGSSRSVCSEIRALGFDPMYLPNGSDPEHFLGASRSARASAKRVVYVGAIDHWFDFDSVLFWARELPDVQFDLYGPVNAKVPRIEGEVNMGGPVEYSDLPRILQHASTGIIPFLRNELTEGVHPIKMYDYLSAGCAVVSSALPEVEPIPGAVWTYSSREEGLDILGNLSSTTLDRGRLHSLAREHSWSSRLEAVLDRLGQPTGAAVHTE